MLTREIVAAQGRARTLRKTLGEIIRKERLLESWWFWDKLQRQLCYDGVAPLSIGTCRAMSLGHSG